MDSSRRRDRGLRLSDREHLYVQYGCGLSAPVSWLNFDSSPVLRLQRLPVVGPILTRRRVRFPPNVRFGDVTRGLPVPSGACRGVYASHVIEHLALNDALEALRETRRLLSDGGRFRCVVPDLRALVASYVDAVESRDATASHNLMRDSCLGREQRKRGLVGVLEEAYGNSRHLWMWDEFSLIEAARQAGFSSVRVAKFNDSDDPAFSEVESSGRFEAAVAIEAVC